MPRPTLLWAIAFLVTACPVGAQQVVEIDFTEGRTIIDDEWQRSMWPYYVAVDWDLDVIYVADNEEPEGVMVFSLDDGHWLRTIETPTGEGPMEFPYGRADFDLAPDGGLFVNGFLMVGTFDSDGTQVDDWRPRRLITSRSVCNFGGAPAVPAQGGVVRQRADGQEETIGSGTVASSLGSAVRILEARLACTDDRAFLVMSYDGSPDSVFVYHANGQERRVVLPGQGVKGMADCRRKRVEGQPLPTCQPALTRLYPSFDEEGNLALFGADHDVHGVIIDPETGCHALVRNTTGYAYTPVAVRADSALVFRTAFAENKVDGRTVRNYRDTASGLSMHPFRHVSGEPCPGMLPSVRWEARVGRAAPEAKTRRCALRASTEPVWSTGPGRGRGKRLARGLPACTPEREVLVLDGGAQEIRVFDSELPAHGRFRGMLVRIRSHGVRAVTGQQSGHRRRSRACTITGREMVCCRECCAHMATGRGHSGFSHRFLRPTQQNEGERRSWFNRATWDSAGRPVGRVPS